MELHGQVDELEREFEQAREDEADYTGKSLSPVHSGRSGSSRHARRTPGHRRAKASAILDDDYHDDDDDQPSVEELEDDLADAKRELGQFEKQARRAGVPPGWLR